MISLLCAVAQYSCDYVVFGVTSHFANMLSGVHFSCFVMVSLNSDPMTT